MKKNLKNKKSENEIENSNLKKINYEDEILTFNDKQKEIILFRYIKEKKVNKIEISINDYINQYLNLNDNISSETEKTQLLYCTNCMNYINKVDNKNHNNHIIKKIEEIKPCQEEFDLLSLLVP